MSGSVFSDRVKVAASAVCFVASMAHWTLRHLQSSDAGLQGLRGFVICFCDANAQSKSTQSLKPAWSIWRIAKLFVGTVDGKPPLRTSWDR